jgi:hypothetical protein
MIPAHLVALTWRHRRPLGSLTALAGMSALATTMPGPTGAALALAAITVGVWSRRELRDRAAGDRTKSRLSRRERRLTAWALAGAAACTWAGPLAATVCGPAAPAALAGTTLAVPSVKLARSRRIRDDAPNFEGEHAELLEQWHKVSERGTQALAGSTIVPGSIRRPGEDSWAFEVELSELVHSNQVTSTDRDRAERILDLPVQTLRIAAIRGHSGRIAVAITPARRLESSPLPWPGPIVLEDGTIPVAESEDGTIHHLPLWNESGTCSWLITGSNNSGKSLSLAVALMSGIASRREVIWYCDGKMGASAPHLRGLVDWLALTPEEWPRPIDAFLDIFHDRLVRRAALGQHKWRGLDETDPVITLLLDEAVLLERGLSARHHRAVGDIVRGARACGMRVVQITHGGQATEIIGGAITRGHLVNSGASIMFRQPGAQSVRLSADGLGQAVNLADLPPGYGWSKIVQLGQISAPARWYWADPDGKGGEIARDIAARGIRTLEGPDAEAAGPYYAARHNADATADLIAQDTGADPRDADTPDWLVQLNAHLGRIGDDALPIAQAGALAVLCLLGGEAQLDHIASHPQYPRSRRTASSALARLEGAGLVAKAGSQWCTTVELPTEVLDAVPAREAGADEA